VADTLLDLASPERVSLVAMATHGRGGVRRFLLGSITDKVIRAAQVPILVMPPVRTPRRARSVQRQKSQAISPGMDFVYA
jgi:CO/xanthine dehydrogenase FAD-binding subunit